MVLFALIFTYYMDGLLSPRGVSDLNAYLSALQEHEGRARGAAEQGRSGACCARCGRQGALRGRSWAALSVRAAGRAPGHRLQLRGPAFSPLSFFGFSLSAVLIEVSVSLSHCSEREKPI